MRSQFKYKMESIYHDYENPNSSVKSHDDTSNAQREEGHDEAIHVGDIEVKEPSGRFKHQSPRYGHTEYDCGKDVLKEGRRPRIGVVRGRQRVARTFSATP